MSPGRIASNPEPHLPGQVHDISIHQEESREVVVLHQPEFFLQAPFRLLTLLDDPAAFGRAAAFGVASLVGGRSANRAWTRFHGIPLLHEGSAGLGQNLGGGFPVSSAFEVGEFVAKIFSKVKSSTTLGDPKSVGNSISTISKAIGHLFSRSQVKECVGSSDGVSVV